VARFENHVRIDKTVTDAWGIPVLHIDVKDSDNELNMAKDAADTMEDLFKSGGLGGPFEDGPVLPAGLQHSRGGHVPHGR
jgi:hypothetical protein